MNDLQRRTGSDEGLALFCVGEVLEILDEERSQLVGALLVGFLVGPCVLGVQQTIVETVDVLRNEQVERFHEGGFAVHEFVVEDGRDDGTGIFQREAFAHAVAAAGPAGVHEVGGGVVLGEFLGELLGVFGRV